MRLEPVYLLGDPPGKSSRQPKLTRRRVLSIAAASGVAGFFAGVAGTRMVIGGTRENGATPLLTWARTVAGMRDADRVRHAEAFLMAARMCDDPALDDGILAVASAIANSRELTASRRAELTQLVFDTATLSSREASLKARLTPILGDQR